MIFNLSVAVECPALAALSPMTERDDSPRFALHATRIIRLRFDSWFSERTFYMSASCTSPPSARLSLARSTVSQLHHKLGSTWPHSNSPLGSADAHIYRASTSRTYQ